MDETTGLELAKCPCGKTPDYLCIEFRTKSPFVALVSGNCCSTWMIECKVKSVRQDDVIATCEKAWNNSERSRDK